MLKNMPNFHQEKKFGMAILFMEIMNKDFDLRKLIKDHISRGIIWLLCIFKEF